MISVIIPVYNSEKTIEKTVECIVNQDKDNLEYEILLINDGSTDQSGKICDALASKNSCIRVIHTENKGASSARNTGIDIAKGQYVTFVDSDDLIEGNMILDLYHALTQKNADFACCGYIGRWNGEENARYSPNFGELIGDREIRKGMLQMENECPTLAGSQCAKLFSLDLIRKYAIRFPENTCFGEDFCFCADYYSHTQKMVFINKAYYVYNMRPGSLYFTYNANTVDMYTFLYKRKIDYYGKYQDSLTGVRTLYLERMLCCFEYTAREKYGRLESLRLMKLVFDNKTFQQLVAEGDYEIHSRYVALLLRLYKKRKLHTIYLISKIKVAIKKIGVS